MSRILVTGGTGTLGREVVSRLTKSGYTVRVMSRSPRPQDLAPLLEWAQVNVKTDEGLAKAVSDVDVIVNSITSPAKDMQQVDIEGTQRLLDYARRAGVGHFFHVSIVGIDRIPYWYYRNKVAAEQVVEKGGVPYSILRATQFHTLIDYYLKSFSRTRFLSFVPTQSLFQPIDAGDTADCIVSYMDQKAGGRLPDIGGPEYLRMGDMAQMWLRVRQEKRLVIPVWLPGGFGHALREGYNTTPNRYGKITWTDWLNKRYGAKTNTSTSTQKASV